MEVTKRTSQWLQDHEDAGNSCQGGDGGEGDETRPQGIASAYGECYIIYTLYIYTYICICTYIYIIYIILYIILYIIYYIYCIIYYIYCIIYYILYNIYYILYIIYIIHIYMYYRRKFRSQTSDNMERWKAEQGRGIEKRKIRRKKSRRERVRRKKIEMREKVGKSRNTMFFRNTVFFQWFVAPEGRKVGSLKRRVRSQLARGEMKNCTPLWREAHHSRTTFGSWDVKKVHAVVARSTFRSQNAQNTSAPDHF